MPFVSTTAEACAVDATEALDTPAVPPAVPDSRLWDTRMRAVSADTCGHEPDAWGSENCQSTRISCPRGAVAAVFSEFTRANWLSPPFMLGVSSTW
eukprot:6914110-Prymnesium_polylepis.1